MVIFPGLLITDSQSLPWILVGVEHTADVKQQRTKSQNNEP